MSSLLTVLLVLPIIGALVVATLPQRESKLAMGVGLGFAFAEFLASVPLATGFEARAGYQFVTNVPWIEAFGIHYHVGIDGFSLWIVLLTTLLTPLCILGAWRSIEKRGGEFVAALLVLQTGMIGSLVALDLILFFTFWELMLIPMYLIIGVWGSEQRVAAATKFFLYTMIGSVFMLAAIIYLAIAHYNATGGVWTFDLEALNQVVLPVRAQQLCFWAFVVSFAIKVPLFPVHTWLPDAHTQAPTPGSVILAGVLRKLGVYGMIRFAFPLFPLAAAEAALPLAILAVIGIVYGALVAYVQSDAKRLVAYSSVSHMGFIVLGIAGWSVQGLTGATYQSLAHGLTTGALFMAIGVLYERRHTRLLSEFGGIAKVMPWFTAVFMIAMLGSAGLPGLVGFVGEFLILLGTFVDGGLTLPFPWILVAIASTGVILGVVYLLHLFQRLMFGPITNPKNERLADLDLREGLAFAPIIALIVAMGLFPEPFTRRIDPTAQDAVHAFTFKRCVSLKHGTPEAEGSWDEPALLEDLAPLCADAEEVVVRSHGDERGAARLKQGRENRRNRLAAEAKAAASQPRSADPPPSEDARPQGGVR
jgi:NADH-quinone oxidoreductase subunit M